MSAYKRRVFFNIPANMRTTFSGNILKLAESGLDDLWTNWAEFWNTWNDTWEQVSHEVPVRSVSLYDSNVRVVFFLFLLPCFVTLLVFLVELGKINILKDRLNVFRKKCFHLKPRQKAYSKFFKE